MIFLLLKSWDKVLAMFPSPWHCAKCLCQSYTSSSYLLHDICPFQKKYWIITKSLKQVKNCWYSFVSFSIIKKTVGTFLYLFQLWINYFQNWKKWTNVLHLWNWWEKLQTLPLQILIFEEWAGEVFIASYWQEKSVQRLRCDGNAILCQIQNSI